MSYSAAANASLLIDNAKLRPGNAVAAVLLDPAGRYLLQLRDRKPGIFFPDYWGCFGGAVDLTDAGDAETLQRELLEELGVELVLSDFVYFSRYTFDMAFCGGGVIYRTFYEVRLTQDRISNIRLAEGQKCELFKADDVLGPMRLTPYDAFALWMHINRSRLKGSI